MKAMMFFVVIVCLSFSWNVFGSSGDGWGTTILKDLSFGAEASSDYNAEEELGLTTPEFGSRRRHGILEHLVKPGSWGIASGYSNTTGVFGVECEYGMREISEDVTGIIFVGLGSGFETFSGSLGFRWMYSLQGLNKNQKMQGMFDSWDTYLYGEFFIGPVASVSDDYSDKTQDIIGPAASVGFRCYLTHRLGLSVSLGLGYAPLPKWYKGDNSSMVPVAGLTANYAI